MTKTWVEAMKIIELHTTHAALVVRGYDKYTCLVADWHEFLGGCSHNTPARGALCHKFPPPPPPPQVVDFKRVTTNHILLFTSISSKYIPFRRVFTKQTSRRAAPARRGISLRLSSEYRLKIMAVDIVNITDFYIFNTKQWKNKKNLSHKIRLFSAYFFNHTKKRDLL
jgi:hypothetical protein